MICRNGTYTRSHLWVDIPGAIYLERNLIIYVSSIVRIEHHEINVQL